MESIALTIKCVFDPGDGEFGGILSDSEGVKICSVTGFISQSLLPKTPKKKTGRPRDIYRHVAVFAHVAMASNAFSFGVRKAQDYVANALAIGSDANKDDQIRAVQRHCAKAREAFPQKGLESFCLAAPEININSAVWMFFETGANIQVSEQMPDGTSTLALRGPGWICNWNDRKAEYGTISLKMRGQSDEHIRMVTETLSA